MLGCLLEMKPSNYGRENAATPQTIRDTEQARLLSDPKHNRYFEPFVARDCTVSQAAKEVGCTLDTMLYRVKTFLQAGLLKIVKTEPRRGRPINVYRSSADSYFIPFEVTPFEDVEARVRRQNRENENIMAPIMARVLRQSGREGRYIYRDVKGEVWDSSSTDGSTPPLDLNSVESIKKSVYQRGKDRPVAETIAGDFLLAEEDAKDLLFEFYDLSRRYKLKSEGKVAKRYFYQFVLVPRDE
jgi:hypothetical protein